MVPKNKNQAPPGTGIKKNASGAFGRRYENAPKTLNIAPEAPKEAVSNEDLANTGIKIEKNDEITAELRYKLVKFSTPIIDTKVLPNDCNTNMLIRIWLKLWCEKADPTMAQLDTLSFTKSPYLVKYRAIRGSLHIKKTAPFKAIMVYMRACGFLLYNFKGVY